MAIRAKIAGQSSDASVLRAPQAAFITPPAHGVVALTHPLQTRQAAPQPFANADYGVAMNQNAAFGGTPVRLHDGVDSVLWTAADIVGSKLTANSTDRAYAGTRSAKVDNPNINDVWEFNSGSTQALSGYTAFSMRVNVDSNWLNDSIEVYGWDGSAEVGDRVALEDYFSQSTFDTWHAVAIPLDDMGLTGLTIESIRMQVMSRDGSKSPTFYIDEFLLEETGTEIEFHIAAPSRGQAYHVFRVIMSMADNTTSTVTNGTVPGLDYTAFLGVSTLALGIRAALIKDGEVLAAAAYKGVGDMCALGWVPGAMLGDGTNTFATFVLEFPEPLVISGNPEDNRLSLTIRDNMSGLLRLTAHAIGANVQPYDESI